MLNEYVVRRQHLANTNSNQSIAIRRTAVTDFALEALECSDMLGQLPGEG